MNKIEFKTKEILSLKEAYVSPVLIEHIVRPHSVLCSSGEKLDAEQGYTWE